MDPHEHYRQWLHVVHPDLPNFDNGSDVPPGQSYASVTRTGKSHRGIADAHGLTELQAGAANQDFLDEICKLERLEYLDLAWPVTAKDLSPLRQLQNLRTLKIDSPRSITDFTPICDLPRLERLFITNAKHMNSLDWMRPMKDRLLALGVEGSMYTVQDIASLAPLEGFALEALFLTNTRLADQDLSAIATMPNIRHLWTALIAPRAQFETLKAARPDLYCQWFDANMWKSFRDPRPPSASNSK